MVESAFVPDGPTADMLSLFKPGCPGGFDDIDISGAMDQVCAGILLQHVHVKFTSLTQFKGFTVARCSWDE